MIGKESMTSDSELAGREAHPASRSAANAPKKKIFKNGFRLLINIHQLVSAVAKANLFGVFQCVQSISGFNAVNK